MSDRRWAPVVALLFSLAALPAHAQTSLASAAATWCADRAGACSDARTTSASTSLARPPAPAEKTDGHFPVLIGAFITAASADLAVSMYQIGRGTAREAAFGASWQNAPVPFALSKSGMAALFALGIQRIHKDRPKMAVILGISATVMESMLVVRSARMSTASTPR